jgi:hypothetical protein
VLILTEGKGRGERKNQHYWVESGGARVLGDMPVEGLNGGSRGTMKGKGGNIVIDSHGGQQCNEL